MEKFSLEDSLRSLTLQQQRKGIANFSERTLVRKVLTIKRFRRFTISKIVSMTLRVSSRIQIDKRDKNIFNFVFICKKDRDFVFNG